MIAEVGIWNVALSDDEVALLAKGLSPLLMRPASLVFYAPLIGRYSPEIDLKGGRNLAVTGATVGDHPRIFRPFAQWNGYLSDVPTPDAPSGLSASAVSSTEIDLSWTDNSTNENGFSIERSTNGITYSEIDTVAADATGYNDETCEPNTLYYYRVRAYNDGGYSEYTDPASAKTPPDSMVVYQYLILNGGQITRSDGRYITLVDGVPEPDTVAGVTWIYVDQDDGDLKVKFGDGHTEVVAADS